MSTSAFTARVSTSYRASRGNFWLSSTNFLSRAKNAGESLGATFSMYVEYAAWACLSSVSQVMVM